ncbi:MAG TPA: transcriptional antiterminator, Rof [Chromatiaceae bacterium]|nr:transcriptional antiterminator, Rof [Chromatiaceae bacterium]
MTLDVYQPIDCGLHSQYELLAMRRARVILTFLDNAGMECSVRGQIVDLFTVKGGEYLRLVTEDGILEVRLDQVLKTGA